jgi:hypothetical protein
VLCCCQDGKAAKDDLEHWGMNNYEFGPDLKNTFELDFGTMLHDDAFRALLHKGHKGGNDQANGFHLEDNPWMDVFQDVRVQGFAVSCRILSRQHSFLISRHFCKERYITLGTL